MKETRREREKGGALGETRESSESFFLFFFKTNNAAFPFGIFRFRFFSLRFPVLFFLPPPHSYFFIPPPTMHKKNYTRLKEREREREKEISKTLVKQRERECEREETKKNFKKETKKNFSFKNVIWLSFT